MAMASFHRRHRIPQIGINSIDYGHYKFGFVHQWVKEHAENSGFSTIDLLQNFSRIAYRDIQITAEDNVHPNALGHKIAAEAFLTWYRSHIKHPDPSL
jgi:lysophospholipase L1-like esterase